MNIDNISSFMSSLGSTLKSLVKMAVHSRPCHIAAKAGVDGSEPLIIMGNGPSLADTMREHGATLRAYPTMAVNFAALAPEFQVLKPKYYILADPHFFTEGDANVEKLWETFARVDWPMTLLVPADKAKRLKVSNPGITIVGYNPVGVEGFRAFERWVYSHSLGMPRPRNVLIPAIMTAMSLGFKQIYLAGADHSWMRTLSVDDDNRVVSIQPHFYKEGEGERERITAVYNNVKLHDVIQSFYVAFRAYHLIASYACSRGVDIFNSTPGSMIDAFPRRTLPMPPR